MELIASSVRTSEINGYRQCNLAATHDVLDERHDRLDFKFSNLYRFRVIRACDRTFGGEIHGEVANLSVVSVTPDLHKVDTKIHLRVVVA